MAKQPPPPTEAERALSALFQERSARFGEAPADAGRAEAFKRFVDVGLPHRRVEAYKYTDLKARIRTLPPPAPVPDEEDVAAALADLPTLRDGSHRIVIANGRLVASHSSAPAGTRLHDILSGGAGTGRVGSLVRDSDDPLTLANVGLFDGGAILLVDGPAAAPVEIVHLSGEESLVMGRLAVIVERDASVEIVERFCGGARGLMNTLAEVVVAPGGSVEWARMTDGPCADTTILSTHHVRVAERASLEHLTIATGKGLGRNQVFCDVAGDDAEAHFRTVTVAIGKRHADNTLVVRHDALDSASSEVFRSAVGEGGVSVVQGRIVVAQNAQKTDAKMMSNALFLDDTGEVVNKPELEIFADDVQCGHGATSGDLDEDPVFYLRARGIPEALARQLLVEAFLLEALERVSSDGLRDAIADVLRAAIGRTDTRIAREDG